MRKQLPTLDRKLAGDFQPKLGEDKIDFSINACFKS